VKSEARWAPASVNQALAAIDNFYRSLGGGRPEVPREDLPQLAPRALAESEQRRFLRTVEASPSARDRAIATVFFYTALRLSELADLELVDVSVTARRGMVRVRAGKGDAYREVPLNSACRKALDELSAARPEGEIAALWLSRQGTRMSSRAIDLVIRRLAKDAGLKLSAHTLRHTVGDEPDPLGRRRRARRRDRRPPAAGHHAALQPALGGRPGRRARSDPRRDLALTAPFSTQGSEHRMPSRILSDREVEQLASWPDEVARSDLAAFFTLSFEDLRWVRSFHSSRAAPDRLGLAVQLCALPFLGFIPADLTATPPEVIERLAARIGVAPRELARYVELVSERSRREHKRSSSGRGGAAAGPANGALSATGFRCGRSSTTPRRSCFARRSTISRPRKSLVPDRTA